MGRGGPWINQAGPPRLDGGRNMEQPQGQPAPEHHQPKPQPWESNGG